MITLNRPLAAFYTYSAACGVFSCISTGLFMSIFLERKPFPPFSRDWADLLLCVELARSHGSLGPGGGECGMDDACSVQVLGMWMDTAAYR